jgi:hypothetical protein
MHRQNRKGLVVQVMHRMHCIGENVHCIGAIMHHYGDDTVDAYSVV